MNGLDQCCADNNVKLQELWTKICDGLQGVSISHFTDDELKVIKSAIEIAGEF